MALIDKAYEWLMTGPSPASDRILGTALTRAEPKWDARIIDVLVARQSDASWAALIQHYQSLPAPIRDTICANRGLMAAGIAIAVRTPDAVSRRNALCALEANPQPCLMYIAANSLRDPDLHMREIAGRVLYHCAEALTAVNEPDPEQVETTDSGDATAVNTEANEAQQTTADDVEHLVRALEDALRMFDAHHRADVLEACLWFAEPLEHRLWSTIGAVRSHAGILVSERLSSWNHPRLAPFLLTALKRPAWRDCVARMLMLWSQPAETAALMRQSRLLDDAEVRARLATMRKPGWFDHTSDKLDELPAPVRCQAPRWLVASGLPAELKLERARPWLQSRDRGLQRNAIYALASLGSEESAAEIEKVVDGESPLANFVRWYVRAIRLKLVPGVREPDADRETAEPPANPDTDFAMLWQLCRRTDATRRSEWMALIRENAAAWRGRIRDCFRAPDPRDRILAIQVASTRELAIQHRDAIQAMLNDSYESIRHLAQTLLDSIQDQPSAGPPAIPPADNDEAPEGTSAQQQQLRELLAGAARSTDAVDKAVVAEIRRLMRDIYGPSAKMEPAA